MGYFAMTDVGTGCLRLVCWIGWSVAPAPRQREIKILYVPSLSSTKRILCLYSSSAFSSPFFLLFDLHLKCFEGIMSVQQELESQQFERT